MAVVGAGAGGMLVAAHLLREASHQHLGLRVVLIDRHEQGGGVAYSTTDPAHLLNVTAARMSALPDQPEDFVRWRERSGASDGPGAYAQRAEYRHYLRAVLDDARRSAPASVSFGALVAEVSAVEPLADRVRVRFAAGGALEAQAVVLALGNLPPVAPAGCERVLAHPQYLNDPWAPGALAQLDAAGPRTALLIGSGLTMVDIAITLAARRPKLRLLAVSRAGLVPRAHLPGRVAPQPLAQPPADDASLPDLVDSVLAASAAGTPDWHGKVDALRPYTQERWQRLSLEQRADFMATRHRAWSVHRHRMAPAVAQHLDALTATGRLRIARGPVELDPAHDGAIDVQLAGGGHVRAAIAVNCTGPGLDPRRCEDPLVTQLLGSGHVRAHPLGMGFDTVAGGGFRSRAGDVQRRLFTLGTPRVGELYETTAMPEIRDQAAELAAALAAMVGGRLALGDAGVQSA